MTQEVNQKISDALGIEDYSPIITAEEKNNSLLIQHNDSENLDADYVRSNYYGLIEKGNEALDGILEVAKQSQHPRAYEVAANMIKNMSDVTEKLMILQKQKQELSGKEPQSTTNIQVDQAVFVGSTAELLKKIKHEEG